MNKGFRLTSWNQPFLTPTYLQEYSRAITRQESPLTNCFGFTEGTVHPISRSGEKQPILYNGHERFHAQIIQSIALPNGLIANLNGPVEDARHDAGMLKDAGLLQTNLTERSLQSKGGGPMSLWRPSLPTSDPGVRQTQTGR